MYDNGRNERYRKRAKRRAISHRVTLVALVQVEVLSKTGPHGVRVYILQPTVDKLVQAATKDNQI